MKIDQSPASYAKSPTIPRSVTTAQEIEPRPLGLLSVSMPSSDRVKPTKVKPEIQALVTPSQSVRANLLKPIPLTAEEMMAAREAADEIYSALDPFDAYCVKPADSNTVLEVLQSLSASEIMALKRVFRKEHGGDMGSLRSAFNTSMSGRSLSKALSLLDRAAASSLRQNSLPLHDFSVDPSGLKGACSDGRLRAEIQKVVELRQDGRTSSYDLHSSHEATSNNRMRLLVDGDEAYPVLFDAIGSAKESVHISYFQFRDDETGKALADLLAQRAQAGVKVRLMMDQSARLQKGQNNALFVGMQTQGVEVIENRLWKARLDTDKILSRPDHRKMVIIDGQTAFTGGMNIGDKYRFHYHDIMVMLQGNIVNQLQCEWIKSWFYREGTIDPSLSPQEFVENYFPKAKTTGAMKIKPAQHIPSTHSEIRDTYLQMIAEAQESIYLQTPYFTVPKMKQALLDAAKRGVPVHVVIPGENDVAQCAYACSSMYEELVRGGVHLYEYPGFNHCKFIITDEKRVSLGSSNFDGLSLNHIYETNLNIEDPEFAKEMLTRFVLEDTHRSKEISIADGIKANTLWNRFWGWFGNYL
ncbi:MAG: phosphatidylserine/phosphatidylglycerophosphate/cardiolipin synthase family protein [Myxococcota bacterium]|nr:phosphatidylserine/phosphatidylglycerophosphate/cardiolipin synthase family protein [Myxococcota bacterium]